jgi:hypothetical protein
VVELGGQHFASPCVVARVASLTPAQLADLSLLCMCAKACKYRKAVDGRGPGRARVPRRSLPIPPSLSTVEGPYEWGPGKSGDCSS